MQCTAVTTDVLLCTPSSQQHQQMCVGSRTLNYVRDVIDRPKAHQADKQLLADLTEPAPSTGNAAPRHMPQAMFSLPLQTTFQTLTICHRLAPLPGSASSGCASKYRTRSAMVIVFRPCEAAKSSRYFPRAISPSVLRMTLATVSALVARRTCIWHLDVIHHELACAYCRPGRTCIAPVQ